MNHSTHLLLLVVALGCGKQRDSAIVLPPATPGKLTVFVAPASTDPTIITYPDSHYVYRNRAVTPLNKLLVFLPGAAARLSPYNWYNI